MNFEECNLHEKILAGVKDAGFREATPIQSAVIPVALEGSDVIGTAQTGTGKTAAFVLPLLQRLMESPKRGCARALIVTPTRELAEQILGVIKQLGKHTPFRAVAIYGGVGKQPQINALRRGFEILVACPGRLLDHVSQKDARLDKVEMVVLDEADRMLDMGFMPSVRRILELLPQERQTLLFSATYDKTMERLMQQGRRQPKRCDVDAVAPAETVSHTLFPVDRVMKNNLLLDLMKKRPFKTMLVFTRTKHRADRVVRLMMREGLKAAALHADKSQRERHHALTQFRSGRLPVLVATDIAARGLDIDGVSHVINYDMPDTATNYIHRIGRTGRASRTGDAYTLATWEDADTVSEIEKILGTPIKRETVEGLTDPSVLPVKQSMAATRSTLSSRHTVTVRRRI